MEVEDHKGREEGGVGACEDRVGILVVGSVPAELELHLLGGLQALERVLR